MPRRGSGLTRVLSCVRLLAGCVAWGRGIGSPICALGMLTKCFHFTRLVTRTKESNMYASIWVANPDAQRKREDVRLVVTCRLQHRPTAFRCGLRPSTHDGTRKMVNFACAG